jgi:hypothetical protein
LPRLPPSILAILAAFTSPRKIRTPEEEEEEEEEQEQEQEEETSLKHTMLSKTKMAINSI